jgi:hypothetical protein
MRAHFWKRRKLISGWIEQHLPQRHRVQAIIKIN